LRAGGKRNTSNESKADVGLVMTVSLFLILLTFFILLNSMAVIDEHKTRQAIGSLLGSFGSLLGGLSPLKTGDSLMPPSAPIVEEKLEISDLLSIMDQKMYSDVKIESREDRAVITINEKLLFDEEYHIKLSSYPLLDNLCNFISKGNYPIEIVGHTDKIMPEGKGYKSDWELSTFMSIQIVKYFAEKGKIQPDRLTPYGHGSCEQIASNDTKESRALNRRIDLILRFEVPDYIKRIYEKKPAGIFTYKKFEFKVFGQ